MRAGLRFLRLFVFGYGVGELVGAGCAITANHSTQNGLNLVYIPAFAEFCHALRIAAAAALERNTAQLVFFVHFK